MSTIESQLATLHIADHTAEDSLGDFGRLPIDIRVKIYKIVLCRFYIAPNADFLHGHDMPSELVSLTLFVENTSLGTK